MNTNAKIKNSKKTCLQFFINQLLASTSMFICSSTPKNIVVRLRLLLGLLVHYYTRNAKMFSEVRFKIPLSLIIDIFQM